MEDVSQKIKVKIRKKESKFMKKWKLNYETAWPYFKDHIEWGNSLSRFLIEKIDFKKGHFFTILPEDSQIDYLENLDSGGILPQPPMMRTPSNKGYWQLIPSTDDSMTKFIKKFLEQNNHRYGLAEEVCYGPNDKVVKESPVEYFLYDKEVYYFLQKKLSTEEINETILVANANYHLLIVLCEGEKLKNESLQLNDFEQISRDAIYIIGSAYDQESYIVWKNDDKLDPNMGNFFQETEYQK